MSVVLVKLLLDENISPKVATALAHEDGVYVCHARDRGLLAATDGEVLERAFIEDRVLVTANVADFVKLAHAREIHPGIVLLEDGALPRDEQIRLVRAAVAALGESEISRTRHCGWQRTGVHVLTTSRPRKLRSSPPALQNAGRFQQKAADASRRPRLFTHTRSPIKLGLSSRNRGNHRLNQSKYNNES